MKLNIITDIVNYRSTNRIIEKIILKLFRHKAADLHNIVSLRRDCYNATILLVPDEYTSSFKRVRRIKFHPGQDQNSKAKVVYFLGCPGIGPLQF